MSKRVHRCVGRGFVLVGLVIVGLVLNGCAVGVQSTPDVVNPSDVPPGLVGPTTTTSPPIGVEYVNIFLAASGHLTAVARGIPAPPSLSGVLAALGRGATGTEATEGLESPISTATPIVVGHRAVGSVTIGISASFTGLSEPEQMMAIAQLIYTVTAWPGVSSVRLRVGGQPVAVPLGNGNLSSRPLTRADYRQLAPL